MPTEHILALLIAERDRLNQAIDVLQRGSMRRGRPPKNVAASSHSAATPRTRAGRTTAQRRAQSKRMKEYWAKRKRADAKS